MLVSVCLRFTLCCFGFGVEGLVWDLVYVVCSGAVVWVCFCGVALGFFFWVCFGVVSVLLVVLILLLDAGA